jgi:hypothetical protein
LSNSFVHSSAPTNSRTHSNLVLAGTHLNWLFLRSDCCQSMHIITQPGWSLKATVSATRTTSTNRPSVVFATITIM